MDENLWGLVSGSFEKYASDYAITYYDSENPEDCLSLTFLQLFQDSEIIYKELETSKKKSPVALRFPDESASLVAAYAAIIAAIRSVRHSFLSSNCHVWDFSPLIKVSETAPSDFFLMSMVLNTHVIRIGMVRSFTLTFKSSSLLSLSA